MAGATPTASSTPNEQATATVQGAPAEVVETPVDDSTKAVVAGHASELEGTNWSTVVVGHTSENFPPPQAPPPSPTKQAHAHAQGEWTSEGIDWSVRKGFRVKCYGLAALQMWFVFGGTMALDGVFNKEEHYKLGCVLFVAMVLSAGISFAALWCLLNRRPWNLIISAATTVEAILFWSMIDLVATRDSYNASAQMLGIVAATLSLNVLVVQIPVPAKHESTVMFGGVLGGWLLAVAVDAILITQVMDIPLRAAVVPTFATLLAILALLFVCGARLTKCYPHDLMVVGFVMHCNQFLVFTMPIIVGVIFLGSSDSRFVGRVVGGERPVHKWPELSDKPALSDKTNGQNSVADKV